jgi:hypothetical protein
VQIIEIKGARELKDRGIYLGYWRYWSSDIVGEISVTYSELQSFHKCPIN